MKTGSVTHTRSVLWWTKEGELQRLTRSWLTSQQTLLKPLRDPQIFNFKGQYYAVVGGRDRRKKASIPSLGYADYHKRQAVGDLDFNDRTAYMMECPNLVFVEEQPVASTVPQKDWIRSSRHTIISFQICIRLGLPLTHAKMVDDVSTSNMDYGFGLCNSSLQRSDGRALAVSWLGFASVSLPILTVWPPRDLLFGQRLISKTTSSTSIQSAANGTFVLLKNPSNRSQTNTNELNLEANSQSEIVLLAR